MAKNHVNLPFLSYSFVKVVVFIFFLAAVFTKDKKM